MTWQLKLKTAVIIACSLASLSFPVFALDQSKENLEPVSESKIEPNRPVRDKWALVIGVSKYADPSIDLQYAAKDAQDLYDYLVTQGHFARDHVKLLLNEKATREEILAELGDKWLPRVASPDDLVLIYISSHGSPSQMDVKGVNYVVAYDTKKESLYATGIPIQELAGIVKDRVHSDRVVLILDACHSGAARPDSKGLIRQSNIDANVIAQGSGQLVICSSEPSQVSWESKQYDNSVFTRRLIEGLQLKGDKTTLGDVYEFMREAVRAEVLHDRGELQVPVMKSKWEGRELELAVPPAKPGPGLIDEDSLLLPSKVTTNQNAPTSSAYTARGPLPENDKSSSSTQVAITTPDRTVQPAYKEPAQVVVFEFAGPNKVKTNSGLGFKLRTGLGEEPSAGDFANLGFDLQNALKEKLAQALGGKVERSQDVDIDVSNKGQSTTSGGSYWVKVAKRIGAKYLLMGSINEVEFEGNLLTGDKYRFVASCKLISGETGQIVTSLGESSIEKRIWTPKGMDPVAVFNDRVVPEIAGRITKRILASISNP